MDDAERAERPIFVVGCARSGTTLVQLMLDSHPSISCGPETLFLEQLVRAEQNNWQRLAAFGITQAQWRAQVRDLFSWVHLQRARRLGKPRWADKSPAYTLFLDYVDALFPRCQVVHVVRDPRDVIDSWRRRWGPRRARQVVRVWPQHVRAGRSFAEAHEASRYTEVRYEELVHDPEATMRRLLEWLEEPWDDQVMAFGAVEHGYGTGRRAEADVAAAWSGHPLPPPVPTPVAASATTTRARSEVVTSSVGVGRGPLNLLLRSELRLRAGALAHELGY